MTAKTETAQESMNTAVRRVAMTSSAEAAINLADAQARLHAANQAEIKNLQAVLDSDYFTGIEKESVKKRLMELLNIAQA